MAEVSQLATAVPGLEAGAGGLVGVHQYQGGEGDPFELHRPECRRWSGWLLVVVPAVAPPFDREPCALEADAAVAKLPPEKWQELDRDVGRFDERELRSAIEHAHLPQHDVRPGNEVDAHRPLEGDVHAESAGCRSLDARLVVVDV